MHIGEAISRELHLLHHLDIEVTGILERIGQLAGVEGSLESSDGIFDRSGRAEADITGYFLSKIPDMSDGRRWVRFRLANSGRRPTVRSQRAA